MSDETKPTNDSQLSKDGLAVLKATVTSVEGIINTLSTNSNKGESEDGEKITSDKIGAIINGTVKDLNNIIRAAGDLAKEINNVLSGSTITEMAKLLEPNYTAPQKKVWQGKKGKDGKPSATEGDWVIDESQAAKKPMSAYSYITELIKLSLGQISSIIGALKLDDQQNDVDKMSENMSQIFEDYNELLPQFQLGMELIMENMEEIFKDEKLKQIESLQTKTQVIKSIMENIGGLIENAGKDRSIKDLLMSYAFIQLIIRCMDDLQNPIRDFIAFAKSYNEKDIKNVENIGKVVTTMTNTIKSWTTMGLIAFAAEKLISVATKTMKIIVDNIIEISQYIKDKNAIGDKKNDISTPFGLLNGFTSGLALSVGKLILTAAVVGTLLIFAPILLLGMLAGYYVIKGILMMLIDLTLYYNKAMNNMKKSMGKDFKEYNTPFGILEQLAKGMMWAIGSLLLMGLAIMYGGPIIMIGLLGFIVLLGITVGVLVIFAVISKLLKSGIRSVENLKWLYLNILLLLGSIILIGFILTLNGTLKLALFGLIGVGVLLAITFGIIWLLSKIDGKSILKAIIVTAVMTLMVLAFLLTTLMIIELGKLARRRFDDILYGAIAFFVIGAVLIGVGWLLGQLGTGFWVKAIVGLALLMVSAILFTVTLALVLVIGEILISISKLDGEQVAVGGVIALAVLAAIVALGIALGAAIVVLVPALAAFTLVAGMTALVCATLTAIQTIGETAIKLSELFKDPKKADLIWDTVKHTMLGLLECIFDVACGGETGLARIKGFAKTMAEIAAVMPVCEAIEKMGSAIAPILKVIHDGANMTFTDENGKKVSIGKADLTQLGPNISTILTALFDGIARTIELHPKAFEDPWIGDSPIKIACDCIEKMGGGLSSIVDVIQKVVKLQYKDPVTGKIRDLTKDDFKNLGENINEIMTALFNAIATTIKNNPEAFEDPFIGDSPIKIACDSMSKLGDIINGCVDGVTKILDLDVTKFLGAKTNIKLVFDTIANILETASGEVRNKKGKMVDFEDLFDDFEDVWENDRFEGLDNLFKVVDQVIEAEEKFNKSTGEASDTAKQFDVIRSVFSGIDETALRSWRSWADTVKDLADNLENVVKELNKLFDVLDDNEKVMADFCANVVRMIEKETGKDLINNKANTTNNTQNNTQNIQQGQNGKTPQEKAESVNKDIKAVLDNIKSTLANIENKFNSGVPVKSVYGSPLNVVTK